MNDCAVDGCYDLALPDSDLCEQHEVMVDEGVWPDFTDEDQGWLDDMTLPGMWEESDFYGGWADSTE